MRARASSLETSTGRSLAVRGPSPAAPPGQLGLALGREEPALRVQLVGRGMLSLRGARREGAGSRGGRVAAEAEELEEGEACSDSDSDADAFVDPDVALSYIDEKLQHVLGHFQKEFEGVSVENFGSRFDGYGSFLPTYQHSPLLLQSRCPHIAANTSTSGSPYQPSTERMDQNPSTVAVEFMSRNNGSGAPSACDLIKKKKCSSTSDDESVSGFDSLDSSFNGSDSKSLKFRTKVCLQNDVPRKNVAIYSGLGLDISSSSSIEESPDGLGGLSSEFSNVPYESPQTILQVMTYFPVPGGFLLSPLSGNLLQLRNKVAPMLKNWETHIDMENISSALEGRSQTFHPPGAIRDNVAKQMKPNSKKNVSIDTKTRKYKGDASAIMNKEVNIQITASQKEKMMYTNNENGFEVGSARKEIPASVKHGQLHMQPTSSVPTMNADPVPAPVAIEDHWVCCDICQKCRLLPYEMIPSMLPKKWQCTMLHWLPGMNSCDISEDETTEALNALTATTFSSGGPQTAGAGTATSSTYNISGHIEQSRKRKNAPSHGKNPAESCYHTPLLTPSMSNRQDLIRNERTTDDMCHSFERDSVSKHSPRSSVSKSADLVSEKLKPKQKNHSSFSYEGGIMKRNKAHPKVKNKIGIDLDEQKTYKKTKMQDRDRIDIVQDIKCDSDGVEVPDEPKALLAKATTMNGSHETGDISLHKKNIALGYDSLENVKNVIALDVPFHCEKKEHPSFVTILDLSCKKDVVQKLEEIQLNSLHCLGNRSKKNLKEKKSNRLKSKEMASKADSRHGKVQHADAMLPSGGHLNYELGADNKFVTGKESLSELWETLPAKQALDLAEPPGRDVAYLQASTAVTSNSSKISSSRRNKNSQQAKDSPVKLASSPPPKNFNIKMISSARKDGTVDGFLSNTHNLVRYHNQNREVIALNNGQQAGNFEGDQVADEPNFHASLQGISDSNIKEVSQSAGAQVSNITCLERNLDNSLPKASWRKNLTVNDTGVGRGDRQLCSGDKMDLDMEVPLLLPDQHPFDRRATTLNTESGPIKHESKNIEIHQGSGTVQRLGMPFKKEKSHLRNDNQDFQKPVAQAVNFPLKEGKQKGCPTSVKSDSLKMKAKLVRSNVEIGVQHGTVKQATSSTLDTSPMRKDGNMIVFALKEARDLKHKANDLKNKGNELESTGLYFEAALKFLHVAFLLETPSFDISRPGDGAQSMKTYSETAKLCNFCAYEYERCEKMAAAALAYKCVEVAYLKSAYYKHPSASKDRRELQAAVQITRGESPSSSVSDVDNLNSYGLSKASSSKVGNSHYVPGNHWPLAVHNQAHLLRLLAYTNDVNLAFDATRKAEFIIASVAGSQERGGIDDGLASVKAVLNLTFNNVNELLRLVRISMESINR